VQLEAALNEVTSRAYSQIGCPEEGPHG
jgi:hypothetical protein